MIHCTHSLNGKGFAVLLNFSLVRTNSHSTSLSRGMVSTMCHCAFLTSAHGVKASFYKFTEDDWWGMGSHFIFLSFCALTCQFCLVPSMLSSALISVWNLIGQMLNFIHCQIAKLSNHAVNPCNLYPRCYTPIYFSSSFLFNEHFIEWQL